MQYWKTGEGIKKTFLLLPTKGCIFQWFLQIESRGILSKDYGPFDSPRTQGNIIHSTTVGGGPWTWRSVLTMCWEARRSMKRKVRYDAVWQMNLIKGFLMNSPRLLLGDIRYAIDSMGNRNPMVMQVRSLTTQCFRRHPGKPSYHRVASNCWQLGWATNCEEKKMLGIQSVWKKCIFTIPLFVLEFVCGTSQEDIWFPISHEWVKLQRQLYLLNYELIICFIY